MEVKDLCRGCIQPEPSNDHKKTMGPVPNPVTEVVSVNRGHRRESSQHYKCSICEAVWERLTEGGAGGHVDPFPSLSFFTIRPAWVPRATRTDFPRAKIPATTQPFEPRAWLA